MTTNEKKTLLRIGGMSCIHCQHTIGDALERLPGVRRVQVHYRTGTADIIYDNDRISLDAITAVIENLNYQVLEHPQKAAGSAMRVACLLVIILSLYMLLQQFGLLSLLVPGRLAESRMGYGMLFVLGLITSVHCIAMCGGINLSQCVPSKSILREGALKKAETYRKKQKQYRPKKMEVSAFKPAILYNLGRVLSYTAVGGVLGFVGMLFGGGSAAGLPLVAQGILKLLAGGFMVLMGMNMLALFPQLRRLQPAMPNIFVRKSKEAGGANGLNGVEGTRGIKKTKGMPTGNKGSLLVGLLNGLMPCGPLQSMQIVALASANPLAGALSMLLFSLGTVPLVLGLGTVVSALGQKFTERAMTVGAVLVVVLGLSMLSQGGSLSGLLLPNTLLAVTLGLCAVGIVSALPMENLRRKTAATLGAAALSLLLIVSWHTGFFGNHTPDGREGNAQLIQGKQVIKSTLAPGNFPDITVVAGTPVQWTIHAPKDSINGCNNQINLPTFGISNFTFQPGDNVISFTPAKAGQFQYSCWMGMLHGSITVREANTTSNDNTTGTAQENGASKKNTAGQIQGTEQATSPSKPAFGGCCGDEAY